MVDDKKPVRMVYLGRRWLTVASKGKGKPKPKASHVWTTEDHIRRNEGAISTIIGCSIFNSAHGARPGMSFVYDVVLDEDSTAKSMFFASQREPKRWDNVLDVAHWETLDREAYAKSQEESIAKRLASEGGLDRMLADVRRVYRWLSPMQRTVFLIEVIDNIRSGDL